jgi:hypothetical protein
MSVSLSDTADGPTFRFTYTTNPENRMIHRCILPFPDSELGLICAIV